MSSRTWSPPSSPDPDENHSISTNYRGMITDPTQSPSPSKQDVVKSTRKKRRMLQYVSPHFAPPQADVKEPKRLSTRKRRKFNEEKENEEPSTSESLKSALAVTAEKSMKRKQPLRRKVENEIPPKVEDAVGNDRKQLKSDGEEDASESSRSRLMPFVHGERSTDVPELPKLESVSTQQSPVVPRIVLGVNIDELSSDSDLTDVPDDIGPDPFQTRPRSRGVSKKIKRKAGVTKRPRRKAGIVAVKELKTPSKPKKTNLTKSPYFPHPHKPRPTFLSTLPFPPLHNATFGLMQERLHRDPFRLLLATIFLNKTPGARAMPIFFQLMEKYSTPQALADAEQPHVTEIIRELGFQNQRARKCIAMAKMWVQDPPVKGRRWRKLNYPVKGDGKGVREDEVLNDDDGRVAWEISHLPGLGPYSHDSWRMFCRDQLRELSSGYNGEDAGDGFEPEWKRVLPADKELRAWMTWMWMKEGWVWNKETGERTKASDELMDLARGKGNIVLESDNNTLMVKSLDKDLTSPVKSEGSIKKASIRVEAPAGDFVPPSQNKADDPDQDSGND